MIHHIVTIIILILFACIKIFLFLYYASLSPNNTFLNLISWIIIITSIPYALYELILDEKVKMPKIIE
jgi:hypothetical protein